MKIINKTKNKILSSNAKQLFSSISKLKGLMFTKKFPHALIFDFGKEKIINVHMFFVFYPIDVLWLNKKKRIVHLKENLKPFTFTIFSKPAKYIIELKKGTIKKTNTSIGDIVSFK